MSHILLLILLFAADPGDPCCRIEGVVRGAAGTPIAAAAVTLVTPATKTPQSTTTAPDGRYAFTGVAPGTWVEIRVMSGGRPIASAFTLVTSFVETLDIRALPESSTPGGVDDLNPMGGDAGEVRGLVVDTAGFPVAGARIAIGDTGVEAVTDTAGRYSFGRVRARLTLSLRVTAPGFATATQEVAVPSGGSADGDFTLATPAPSKPEEADADGIGVGIAGTVPDRASLELRRQQLAGIPSLAPYDAFRAATILPAATVGLDPSDPVVHGAAPDETRVALDDFTWYPFPRLFAGLTAPLNTAAIDETTVTPESVETDGGGRLSGLMRLKTGGTAFRKPAGTAEIATLGLTASGDAPIGRAGSILVAARHSWPTSLYENALDRFTGGDLQYARDRSVRYSGGTLAASPGNGFYDVNARGEFAPGHGNRFSVSFYRAKDEGNDSRDAPAPAPSTGLAIPSTQTLPDGALVQIGDVQIGDVRTWTGGAMSAVWQRRWSADLATTATVAHSRFENTRDQAFFPTSAALAEHNTIEDTTVRVSASIAAGFAHAIDAGVERVAVDAAYDGRQEAATGLAPLLTRDSSAAISTAFAQDVWRLSPRLTVTPGLRLTRVELADASYADPRASASYAAAPGVVLKAAWSIDHQAVNRIVREDREHGDGAFWALSDGTTIPVARSQQASAGASVQFPGGLFDAHVYYRRLDDLTLFAPRLLPGTALADPDGALYTGTGSAAGLELLVQHRQGRNSLWAGYSAGRVEYSYPALEAATFPASFDRLHQFRFTDTMRLRGNWSATGAWLAGSGLPYTPSTGAQQVWFPSGALAYQPAFGAKNASRLPPYHQLDVSSQIAHHFGAVATTLGVTVFNVYNRTNVAAYDYEAAGTTAITSQTQLMPRAANVFFRVGF